jgi:hypothetical protein
MTEIFRVPFHEFVRVERSLGRGEWQVLDEVKKPTGHPFDAELAKSLVSHVASVQWRSNNDLDGWLAPRVHALLRIPRRVASDRGVWFWLAATTFRPYVEQRFGPEIRQESKDPWWRYSGDFHRNAISRLWWGAEMLRDGPDYSLVAQAFSSVRTFMFISELKYSWHREGARAFSRVVSGDGTEQTLGDDLCQELSKRFNTYLSLDLLEGHEPSPVDLQPTEFDSVWAGRSVEWKALTEGSLRTLGPATGQSDKKREAVIVAWLRTILREIEAVAS